MPDTATTTRATTPAIHVPDELRPADGRFGSGPSKVPPQALDALAATGTSLMGTSHRQPAVKALVGRVREKLEAFFAMPDGYQVVMGNGGTTAFWEVAAFGLVRERAQHASYGEFTSKFAAVTKAAPWLQDPSVVSADPGTLAVLSGEAGIDAYAWAHNETSTGVMAPVRRIDGADPDALVLIDATSGAAGLPVDLNECDAYYFAPQKGFASDGGLWVALLSPAALERAAEIAATDRYVPAFFDLPSAIDNSAKDQTLNTPSVATYFLLEQQLDRMLGAGGLPAMVERTRRSSETLYAWAEAHPLATPYVADPAHRSQVVGTIDLEGGSDGVSADEVAAVLRENGIVDTESYRKLGRNQLRIAMFPAVDPEDVAALTGCLDYVLERLASNRD